MVGLRTWLGNMRVEWGRAVVGHNDSVNLLLLHDVGGCSPQAGLIAITPVSKPSFSTYAKRETDVRQKNWLGTNRLSGHG